MQFSRSQSSHAQLSSTQESVSSVITVKASLQRNPLNAGTASDFLEKYLTDMDSCWVESAKAEVKIAILEGNAKRHLKDERAMQSLKRCAMKRKEERFQVLALRAVVVR